MVKKVKSKVPTPKKKGQATRPTRPNIPVVKTNNAPKVQVTERKDYGAIDDDIIL